MLSSRRRTPRRPLEDDIAANIKIVMAADRSIYEEWAVGLACIGTQSKDLREGAGQDTEFLYRLRVVGGSAKRFATE